MRFYKRFLPKLNQTPARARLETVPTGQRIPKIIHQTFYTDALPPELRDNVYRLKEMNPGWEYRFYNDRDIQAFIAANFDACILTYFNRINPNYGAARADLFRYLVVYRCGGVYLDIKSTTILPLDEVIRDDDTFLLSHWKNKAGEEFEGFGIHPELDPLTGELQQWHVISVPGHPLLKAVIENVLENINRYLPSLHGVAQHGVMRVTGPVAYTLAIAPLLKSHPHRLVSNEAEIGLKYSIYKKFSHMHIYKSTHYTVLKESIVLLSRARTRTSHIVVGLQRINDTLNPSALRKLIKEAVLPQINRKPKNFPLQEFPPGQRIPKILHQTYFKDALPPELQENVRRIRAMNPGWEYRFYNDSDIEAYISANFHPSILKSFNRINPDYGAARADLFRYLLMYKEGGVYLDVKSSMTEPLDSFLLETDTYVLAQWRDNQKNEARDGWGLHYELRHIAGGEFQQWHVIAAAGHPFLRKVICQVLTNIDSYVPALHGVGKNGVLRVTGPTAYTLAIAPLLRPGNHRMIDRRTHFPLEYSVYGHDAHFKVFKSHYSQLATPVVATSRPRYLLSQLISRLQARRAHVADLS